MAQDVLCEVTNCVHHAGAKKCGATEIFVVSNKGKASNSEETDCKTFEPGM